jgi:energy-coupling factor transporter ATP-binding protein EcfA2
VNVATHEEQIRLLDAISRMGSAGRAEGEDKDRLRWTFWPVPEHLRAFDPDVVLIVGPRGAGKTELFRAVVEQGLLPEIAGVVRGIRLPPLGANQTRWIAGYPIGADFPSHLQLKRFVDTRQANDALFLELWLAYLVRVSRDEIRDPSLDAICKPEGGDVAAVIEAFHQLMAPALLALDRLDQRLVAEDRYLFVAYDELDTLARGDTDITRLAVRGLVGLWATHTRRWRRIRSKIFLRTDLYGRSAAAGGADFAKLAANRAELAWSDRHLYAMLVKRLANANEELGTYCGATVTLERNPTLGLLPSSRQSSDFRPLFEKMIGRYMGANERKGLTFRWLLDHIRDGRTQALPRPAVRLLEAAADLQRNSGTFPRWPRLIEPRSLRRALDTVSNEHVSSALDEWPWIAGLKQRLASIREVPWEHKEIESKLQKTWHQPWLDPSGTDGIRPPGDSARELVDYLIEVGIFRARSDGRVDVPDLFLAGLGLKRRGGVGKT